MRILCLLSFLFISIMTKAQRVDSLMLMQDLKELSSDKYEGRKPGTYGGRLAQYYLINRFKAIGLKEFNEHYKHPFAVLTEKIAKKLPDSVLSNYKYFMGANICGYVQGQDSGAIVVSAHYDHVGVIDGKIHNGADDNASGTSALLALAAYFKANPPEHTLIFVGFDAEELGMKGSISFLSRPPVPVSRMKLNVNMDMIGTSSFDKLYIAGTRFWPIFKPQLKSLISKNSKLDIAFGYDDDNNSRLVRSDHAPFHFLKVPFIYFGVPEHVNYHQPSDDYENISHTFFYHTVNFILKTVIELDSNFPVIK